MADAGNLSSKTESGDLYYEEQITTGTPLSEAERFSTGEFSKDVTITRSGPNTSIDMFNAEKWQLGDDDPKGTFAKSIKAYSNYRDDMKKGKNKDKNYKHIYVDTMSARKKVSEQLIDLKK